MAGVVDIAPYRRAIRLNDLYAHYGKVEKIVGMMVEATGVTCNIGDVCNIQIDANNSILAEAVGLKGNSVQLMPYQDVTGIGFGSVVIPTGQSLTLHMSDELIGRTVDALGNPIDGGPAFQSGESYSINGTYSNPMDRPPITDVIEIGIKAIDGLLTIGKGQRMGIFAGSGVGKSTLMGMIARNIKALSLIHI